MRKKITIILVVATLILFLSGITYSKFNIQTSFIAEDQKIASFVFEGKKTDDINISLEDLTPGDTKEYSFSVSNNNENKSSEVNLNYQFMIKTYHFIPFVINLYKIDNDSEKLVFTCDETFSRDEENKLICNSDIFEMPYETKINDNYKLKIEFPSSYNSEIYSNVVDYVDFEIKSWQK